MRRKATVSPIRSTLRAVESRRRLGSVYPAASTVGACFESALGRDPAFVRARVGVAACRERPASEGVLPFLETTQRARREAERAIRKDWDLAEAYSVLAGLLMLADEIVGTQREARRAIELSPILADPY